MANCFPQLPVSPDFPILSNFLISYKVFQLLCTMCWPWLQLSNSMCPTFRAWIAAFPDATWLTSRPFTGLLMKQNSPLSLRDWVLFLPISASYLISYFFAKFLTFPSLLCFCCLNLYPLLISCKSHFFSRQADLFISLFLTQQHIIEEREWVKGETGNVGKGKRKAE